MSNSIRQLNAMILIVVCLVIISIQLCYIICRDYFIYRKYISKGAISLWFSDMVFHHLSAEFSKQIQAANNGADGCVNHCDAKCASQCAVAYEAVTAQISNLAAFEVEMQKTIDSLIIKVSLTFKLVVKLKSSVSNLQASIVDKHELHALSAQLTEQQSILLDIKESFKKELDTSSGSNDTNDTLVHEDHHKSMSPGVKKQSVVLVGAQRDHTRNEYGMLIIGKVYR